MSKRSRSRKVLRVIGATALSIGMMLAFVGTALAEDSPSTVTASSTQLNWTGQGLPVNQQCGDGADFGAGGAQNGATADNYLLWIFATDGGSVAADPTLTVNGVTYGNAYKPAGGASDFGFPGAWQIVTPAPATITSAFTTFVVADTGNGKWVLTISHGCTGNVPEAALPTITKDAAGTYDDTYVWSIDKSVDKTYVEIQTAGGTATFNYTVTVTHGVSQDSNFQVKGTVTVSNSNGENITLDSLTEDGLSDGTACSFDDPLPSPLVMSPGDNGFTYTCDATSIAPGTDVYNTASMSWSEQTLGDGSHLAGSGGDVSAGSVPPIALTKNEVDECNTVSDPVDPNSPHTFCVGDSGEVNNGDGTYSFTFTYSRTVSAPALGQCVPYDNTASFETNDTHTKGSDKVTVTVCRFNAPLTIGYWGNHLAKTRDPLCPSGLPNGTGCSSNGPFTVTYLGQSICNGCATVGLLGTYNTGTGKDGALKAAKVFAANNCSNASTSNSNAAACLAAQLLAADLNVANGANFCICDTIKAANAFLVAVGYNGPGSAVTFSGTNTRAYAIQLKTALDNYNNNKGCPA